MKTIIASLTRKRRLLGVRRESAQQQNGMTLIELMVALMILSVVSTGMIFALLSASQMNTFTAEQMLADTAIREKMAEVRANAKLYTATRPYAIQGDPQDYTGLDALIRIYQDPAHTTFLVEGLELIPGETVHGRILLYLDERRVPVETESEGQTFSELDPVTHEVYEFGPKDLNGDGDTADNILALGHTNGVYPTRLVPVEIRLRWKSVLGHIMTERRFLLLPRTNLRQR